MGRGRTTEQIWRAKVDFEDGSSAYTMKNDVRAGQFVNTGSMSGEKISGRVKSVTYHDEYEGPR